VPSRRATTVPNEAQEPQQTDVDQIIHLTVCWEAYENLSAGLGDSARARPAFDGATLEIMSPGFKHERIVKRFSVLITAIRSEWRLNLLGGCSTRYLRRVVECGAEPDASYP
jgi:Uma2 family endonuclease